MGESTAEQAFLQAYDELADPLFRLCYFRLFDKEVAQEVVQESFKKVWLQISDGKKIKNLKAFLYQTTRNLIVDTARKGKFRNHLPLEELMTTGRDPGSHEHEQILARAEVAQLKDLLETLNPEDKEILLLRHMEQYAPREIGEILGLSANVVSVRLHRATKQMQKTLKEYE
jgi:RNA polymerase sigma-70 factor (ECF subfamily)